MKWPKKRAKQTRRIRLPLPGFIRRIGHYIADSWRELRRVTWPSRKEAWKLTFAVGVFSVVFAVIIRLIDWSFEQVVKQVFL